MEEEARKLRRFKTSGIVPILFIKKLEKNVKETKRMKEENKKIDR